jgi:hypothetical protein
MEFPSYLLAYGAALAIALLGVVIVRWSQKKHQMQTEQRRDLVKRGKSLPLAESVQQAGISLGKFFYSTPLNQVHQTIEFCESCNSEKRCKLQSSQAEVNTDELELCPVIGQIDRHSQ